MSPDTIPNVKKKKAKELFIMQFTRRFVVLLGAFIIYLAVHDKYEGNASEDWPTTQGRIVSSLVKEEFWHYIVPSYSVNITYRCAVNGKRESSDRITVEGNEHGELSEAQSIVSKYPVGSNVTVHYSPTDSSRSVLKTGTDRGYVFIFAACGLALICWAFFFMTPARLGEA